MPNNTLIETFNLILHLFLFVCICFTFDVQIPRAMFDSIQTISLCSMSLLTAAIASWYLLFLILICIVPAYWSIKLYLPCARRLRRLDSITRSPIFALFSNIYAGLDTIRAFNKEAMMLKKGLTLLDINSKTSLMIEAIARWFGIMLDGTASALITCATFLSVYLSVASNISSSDVGLVLLYMITLIAFLQWAVKVSTNLENFMTSTERIVEYANLEKEDKLKVDTTGDDENNEWVTDGRIEIKNLQARYGEDLNFVLNGINVSIGSKEKIGIVGRTGCGKSSLFLTFFRLLEPHSGCIQIDGTDCSQLSLFKLRSNLSIIPQTPVLFSETVRYNIDPFDQYTDDEILNVLKIVKLDDLILNKLSNGLNTMMSENGGNFSVGESQLICVARALLKKSKILLIDEATSNVDTNTDLLIQNILKEKFKNCTVLTIAHRLKTILHCDKILVMESGSVVEFDTPANLLSKDYNNDKTAVFAKMYNEAINSSIL